MKISYKNQISLGWGWDRGVRVAGREEEIVDFS